MDAEDYQHMLELYQLVTNRLGKIVEMSDFIAFIISHSSVLDHLRLDIIRRGKIDSSTASNFEISESFIDIKLYLRYYHLDWLDKKNSYHDYLAIF